MLACRALLHDNVQQAPTEGGGDAERSGANVPPAPERLVAKRHIFWHRELCRLVLQAMNSAAAA